MPLDTRGGRALTAACGSRTGPSLRTGRGGLGGDVVEGAEPGSQRVYYLGAQELDHATLGPVDPEAEGIIGSSAYHAASFRRQLLALLG